MKQLYKTLKQLSFALDVAEHIEQILDHCDHDRIRLKNLNFLNREVFGYPTIVQPIAEPIAPTQQVDKVFELFDLKSKRLDVTNTQALSDLIAQVSALLGKNVGQNNFISDRRNKVQRQALDIDLSKRGYNKRWRLLKRLEDKLQKYNIEREKIEIQKIAYLGITHLISFEEFSSDPNSAYLIAYFTAQCNTRSVFTSGRQERSFDQISQILFERCQNSPTTSWYTIAKVNASQEVLAHLNDHQKGSLLGLWTGVLQDVATKLKQLWQTNNINRQTMIAQKGNDSYTWDNTVVAWNKARDHWMNLIYLYGMDEILDAICFGKVLSLVSAHLLAMHCYVGNKYNDPNTVVWDTLPLPWEVFEGKALCNRALIRKACQQASIDPEKSGWIAPKTHKVATCRPTPELVHGVEVNNPFLAKTLRKKGYFSEK